jgi:hypothetical protein
MRPYRFGTKRRPLSSALSLSRDSLQRLYRQVLGQLEHFLGYEPGPTEALLYLAKTLMEEGRAFGSEDSVASDVAQMLGIEFEPGLGMAMGAGRRRADWFRPWMMKPSNIYPFNPEDDLDLLEEDPEPQEESRQVWASTPRFQVGDRVQLLGWDPISGISDGSLGTVALVRGLGGVSPYPDPARRLILVRWDEYGLFAVPVKKVEKIRTTRRGWTWPPATLHDDEAPFDPRLRLEPQEHQPMEGGEDGPSQESKNGSLRRLTVARLDRTR